jgi:excisionase family DNA binding protein
MPKALKRPRPVQTPAGPPLARPTVGPLPPDPTALLTIEEVAAHLRVHPSFLYEESRKGSESRFPFRRIGRFLRIKRADLDRWLDQRAVGGKEAS